MPQNNVGDTLTVEAGRVYIILAKDDDEDIKFGIISTLDTSNEEDKFLACLARGMIERGMKYTSETVVDGIEAFERDHAPHPELEAAFGPQPQPFTPQSDAEPVTTADGNVVMFPKTVGNA